MFILGQLPHFLVSVPSKIFIEWEEKSGGPGLAWGGTAGPILPRGEFFFVVEHEVSLEADDYWFCLAALKCRMSVRDKKLLKG
jgi:hypothetical protein